MKEHKERLVKWLRVLFYIQIAFIVITLINAVSNLDHITQWISKALNLAVVWSLFQLREVNPRYKTAAITSAGAFLCGLPATSVNTSALAFSGILMLAGSILSLVAAYQEYHGHGEISAAWDAQVAKKWNSLFGLEILASIAVTIISAIVTGLLLAEDSPSSLPATITIVISTAVGLLMHLLYLLYMKQTLSHIEAEA